MAGDGHLWCILKGAEGYNELLRGGKSMCEDGK